MVESLFSARLAAFTVLAILAGFYSPHHAHGRHRRSGHSYNYSAIRQRQQQTVIQAALAQRNAAQQVLSAAQATGGGAQDKLNSALSKLRDEAQKFHDAQSTTRQAAKELAEIEEDILDEQGADSPYKQGLKKVEEARQNLKQVEDRIVGESAVQAKLAGLNGNSLLEAKDRIFEFDNNYQAAKGELSAQGSALAKIRTELFQADKHWKEAEGNTHGGASGRVGLNLKAKSAGEAAATAKAAIAQAEAVLRANGAGNLINNNSSANNSRSSGKKSNK
jgi:hypothetical protein